MDEEISDSQLDLFAAPRDTICVNTSFRATQYVVSDNLRLSLPAIFFDLIYYLTSLGGSRVTRDLWPPFGLW